MHPDGRRLVTGGGDHEIKVWSTAPILSEAAEAAGDAAHPRLLATLSRHHGPVNVVRWSPGSGALLASGSDDNVVLLWAVTDAEHSSAAFGTAEAENVEHYRNIESFKQHTSHVSDLAFSADGRFLASASFDATVVVYQMSTMSEVSVLRGHRGLVKGVTWDPVGNYLASQGDDRTVRVWRTNDWAEEACVEAPYAMTNDTCFSRRLAWSPDGSMITTTHAHNGRAHTAHNVERDAWEEEGTELIGHARPVDVVRYNPVLFGRHDAAGKMQQYTCVAIGSQDRSVSVWVGGEDRPLAVARKVALQSVSDLTWSSDGMVLAVSSLQGEVTLLEFTADELGSRIPEDDRVRIFREAYGDLPQRTAVTKIIENPTILGLQKRGAVAGTSAGVIPPGTNVLVPRKKTAPLPQSTLSNISHASATSTLAQQHTSKTIDGRKRVQPVLVQPMDESVTGASFAFAAGDQSMPGEKGKEKVDAPTAAAAPPPAAVAAPPASVAPPSAPVVAGPAPSAAAGASNKRARQESGTLPTATVQRRRGEAGPSMDAAAPGNEFSHVFVNESDHGERQVTLSVSVHEDDAGCSSTVGVTAKGRTVWTDRVPARVTVAAASRQHYAVGCDDGTLFIYSSTGRRLLPCVVLARPFVQLTCSPRGHLLAVLTNVSLVMWDLASLSVQLETTLAPALTQCRGDDVRLRTVAVTSTGRVTATMTDGVAFAYHVPMRAWVRVADRYFQHALFHSRLGSGSAAADEEAVAAADASVLEEVQDVVRARLASAPGRLLNTVAGAETIAHLENQLASALALGDAPSYVRWARTYVRFLARKVEESRLIDYCGSLLGPVQQADDATAGGQDEDDAQGGRWQPMLLGFPKRDLLRQLIPVMASENVEVQRIVTVLQNALREADDRMEIDGGAST